MRSLDATEQRLGVALYRLLAEGAPVSTGRLASEVGLGGEQAADILRRWPNVFYDAAGDVVAYGGLALFGGDHELHVDGRTLYTWCAWDTLFIPLVLEREAAVRSVDPTTREPVSLTVGPNGVEQVSPPSAVLSFVTLPDVDGDVIQTFCRHVRFFGSRAAAERWAAEREGGSVLSIDEGFELGRQWAEATYGAALETVPNAG